MHTPYKSRIELPERFREILNRDPDFLGPIDGVLGDFSIWLGRNQTVFFPEYTDHGIDHVTNVLISACRLINESSWSAITPADVSALVSSVLLHDCAMHITQDGFFELLSGDAEYRASKIGPIERSWIQEFEAFQQEAARWDAARLMSVFGDHYPAELLSGYSSVALSDRQKLMVGEFLRRQHARIAHQIALNGVPGNSAGEAFVPFYRFSQEQSDLYGFLARSHNFGIRFATDLLPPMRRRTYLGTHPPFVMAVLRIADYIQIDAARAPTQILQLRGLKSPVSRSEWAKHHAVLELHQDGDDPEALNVVAEPNSVEIFSGLRRLFQDLQKELDESWALLGEVYGRHNDLKTLGLTVRRLVSNLDNPDNFEKISKPAYIPHEVRLSTASAELLELLVGPLYGNRPTVGARELIQNAIDSVIERSAYIARHGSKESYSPLVEVELEINEHGTSYFRVTDNGVGMTLDTVESYFLKAGASFRKSQWWKSEYVDDAGRSLIKRSGRFGIGSLASFLIGDKISVQTRHFSEETGSALNFDLAIDGALVEISRKPGDIGTTISVGFNSNEITNGLLAKKSEEGISFSDWYMYGHPIVKYRVFDGSEWVERQPKIRLPVHLLEIDSGWVPLDAPSFGDIYWSYTHPILGIQNPHKGFVACNGIFVSELEYRAAFPKLGIVNFQGVCPIRHPILLVDDPEGRLPLNIQRDGLAERRYPFQVELEKSIADVYAREIYLALEMDATPGNLREALEALESRLAPYHYQESVIGLSKKGWIPLDETLLSRFKPNVVAYELLGRADTNSGLSKLDLDNNEELILLPWRHEGAGVYRSVAFVRGILGEALWGEKNFFEHWQSCISGYRFFIRNDVLSSLEKKAILPKFIWRQLKLVLEKDNWSVFDAGDEEFSVEKAKEVIDRIKESDCRLMALVAYHRETNEILTLPELTPFANAWLELPGIEIGGFLGVNR